nr:PRC-barrel domain-containing protein [Sphingomonas sp.]
MNVTDDAAQHLLTANLGETMKVKSREGKTIGAVHAYMIHKRSGRAMYAVLRLGGFLGIGKAYYAVPVALLAYDSAGDQYIASVEPKVLEGGPSWASTAPAFDQDYADRVASYYGADRQDLAIG